MPPKNIVKKKISLQLGITITVMLVVAAGIGSYLLRQGIEEVIIPNIYIIERDGKLIVGWRNLPEGTTEIRVARTNREGTEVDWLVIQTGGASSGEFVVGNATEGDNDYSYTFSAVSGNGKTVYETSGVVTKAPGASGTGGTAPPTGTTPPPTTTPPPQTTPPPAETPAPVPTPQVGPTPPQGETPPQTTPPQPQGEVYYTPSGEVSGTAPAQTKTFWVAHRDKKILINWQNIPADTDLVIVYRSNSESSLGSELLRQEQVSINYTISLLDNTLNVDQYYTMRTYKNGSQTASYGPELLPALE